MKQIIIYLLLGLLFSSCIEIINPHEKLPPGMWRGVLFPDKVRHGSEAIPEDDILAGNIQLENVGIGEIPFNFEVVYDDPQNFHIIFYNADERIKVTDIQYGIDRRTAKDTLTIDFPIYNSRIKAIFEENVMEGEWIVMDKANYSIPFAAFYGKNYRFTDLKKTPVADLSGKWEVYFGTDTDQPTPAIGEFQQDGNRITGTFLLETGDYRYLEGTVQHDKMYLSTFDGAVAYLFEAKITDSNQLVGTFRSGKHYKTTWEGKRSSNVVLRDPGQLSQPSGQPMLFTFPDHEGKMTSLSDPVFEGKPKVIQIMGTWCRNCMDETRFLVEQYQKYHQQGLEIIALAFERPQDTLSGLARLSRYKDRLEVPYPVLLAGLSISKKEASEKLPALSEVFAFPTTIFLDRENRIVKVHTGIYGPASDRYEEYVHSFENTIRLLLDNSNNQ